MTKLAMLGSQPGALLSLELEKGLEPSDHLQGIPPMHFFSLPTPHVLLHSVLHSSPTFSQTCLQEFNQMHLVASSKVS